MPPSAIAEAMRVLAAERDLTEDVPTLVQSLVVAAMNAYDYIDEADGIVDDSEMGDDDEDDDEDGVEA